MLTPESTEAREDLVKLIESHIDSYLPGRKKELVKTKVSMEQQFENLFGKKRKV